MALIFLILFIAALVGVLRPYKFLPQGKRWHYGLAAFASFVAIIIIVFQKSHSANMATTGETRDVAVVASTDKPASPPAAFPPAALADETPQSKWVYDSQTDEMRGKVAKFATLNSENTIKFDFPYGEQPGIITVRQDPQYGLDVMFSLPSGQSSAMALESHIST